MLSISGGNIDQEPTLGLEQKNHIEPSSCPSNDVCKENQEFTQFEDKIKEEESTYTDVNDSKMSSNQGKIRR